MDIIPDNPVTTETSIPDFDKLLKIDSQEILGKIKWQLGFTARVHGKEAFDPKRVGVQLDGLLRGDLTERLSSVLAIDECTTVYNSADVNPNELKIISFQSVTDERSKEGVLAYAVKKSIEEKPLTRFQTFLESQVADEGKRNTILAEVRQEVVEGYSERGRENPGIFYGETVIPDQLLTENGEIKGFVEVKGYKPDEFAALVTELNRLKGEGAQVKPHAEVEVETEVGKKKYSLGVDLNREIEFVDILRNVGFGLPSLENDMPIIIRVPSDIRDEDIKSYGELLKSLHYYKVIIQKLPISSTGLEQRAKQFVAENSYAIQSGQDFSKREKAVLKEYSKLP